MIRVQSHFGRAISLMAVATLLSAMVPTVAYAEAGKSGRKLWNDVKPKPPVKLAPSKILSARTMSTRQGRSGENPYAAGQSKWDVVHKGINVMTGNYTTEATDLSFEGGYGIPVNVTRSYSSNNGEEGPLGKGWTLSVDVRSTAGGLIKSGSAPVRSVPVNFKERPSTQIDPNAVTADGALVQPVQAVLATDAAGTEETIQRDADGILSTPPWDKNKIESEYETVVMPDGTNIQVMTKNYVNTPDGTVYVYEKQGEYINGVKPFNNSSAASEKSNVLKISTTTDRHGNVTTYTYNPNVWVTFAKVNGAVQEHPLTQISMPNGHVIQFTWTGNRITAASEVTGSSPRVVQYAYNAQGMLTGVTTPGGKLTQYGYSNPPVAAYGNNTTPPAYLDVATNILSSITDPRGLTTNIYSAMMLHADWNPKVATFKIQYPNGMSTHVRPYASPGAGIWNSGAPDALYYNLGQISPIPTSPGFQCGQFQDFVEATLEVVSYGYIQRSYGTDLMSVYRFSGPIWQLTGQAVESSFHGSNTFELDTQNLVESVSRVSTSSGYEPGTYAGPALGRNHQYDQSTTVSSYNFMGNPLEQQTTISRTIYGQASPPNFTTSVSYSYWGAEKYYQRKAVKDQVGRYTYTDYFDSSAATGKKGQTYKIYDEKRTTFVEDTNIPIPVSVPACPTDKYWKYRLVPQSDTYSAMFDYDSKGRPIKVWKLQSTTSTPWTYVRTDTTYGADQAPAWGAATQVTEDAGGINRTTETLAYDGSGRAIHVRNAAGHEFYTNYDADGVIQSVLRGGSSGTPLVTYAYGSSGLLNGMVTGITDGLSNVAQTFAYATSGSAIGQVSSVTEVSGTDTYSTSYTYNTYGDRATSTYSTQAALGAPQLTVWRYDGYRSYGDPTGASRAFRKLTRLDSATGQPTAEEFHYDYDSSGRLQAATFGLTPNTSVTAPLSNGSWYNTANPGSVRGRAWYEYTMQGQLARLNHWWDTWNGSAYTSQFIRGNEAAYEVTGMKRGLKTASAYLVPQVGNPANWQTQRTETYSYDSELDYLVGANYGDGLPNQSMTWGYDAAGNRTSDSANPGSWVYDNLNRMTASPGATYTNDVLGSRLSKNSTAYAWDRLGRMTSTGAAPTVTTYDYRADGMRTRKSNMQITTRYRYDGQMGVEDLEFSTGGLAITKVTRYGLGARGIDVVSQTTGSGNAVSYPLYDTHGNNIGSLTSNGTTFTVGDERGYDAWGGVRSGIADGAARYCANIGHKQDDESGLIYMRARYYEPGSGRFVSEDPAMDGLNWFTYVRNSPVNAVDSSGMFIELLVGVLLDEFLNVADGSASAAAHSYAKSKIQDACSYWAGRLVGVLIESQIEDLYGEVTSRGFGFGNEKGSFFFDFDGKDHGGKIHVDTYGKIRHYVQSTCKSSNYRIDLFIKGLQDSLIK